MWQRWHKSNSADLKREIDRLAVLCPQSPFGFRRYAMRAGGYYPRGFNHRGY
jgi:hypothetical protein